MIQDDVGLSGDPGGTGRDRGVCREQCMENDENKLEEEQGDAELAGEGFTHSVRLGSPRKPNLLKGRGTALCTKGNKGTWERSSGRVH